MATLDEQELNMAGLVKTIMFGRDMAWLQVGVLVLIVLLIVDLTLSVIESVRLVNLKDSIISIESKLRILEDVAVKTSEQGKEK
jgi:hypothetical protein